MPTPLRPSRDASIDFLRGLVMCLMVLDHARDFFTSSPFAPTDPDKTHAALFFTRWVTHFCAPVFMLLAGAGAGISRDKGRSIRDLAKFLVSRGLWLVVLELTWVRFGWAFDLSYHSATGQVIWALGWCMVVLAGLVFLPTTLIALVGVVLVAGHNLLDPVQAEQLGRGAWLWRILHEGGPIELSPEHGFYVAYPLLPWIGVMALGYLLGLAWDRLDRRRLVAMGSACVVCFLVLRVTNVYGDPDPFIPRSGLRTVFAFLACMKYPPSLDYVLMTLGPSLVLLGILRGRSLRGPIMDGLVTLGRVPLFFYLLHIPLVHALSLPWRAAQHLPLVAGPFQHGLDLPLPIVYGVTLLSIAMLWWPSRRWAALKAARPGGWLSYL